MNRSAEPDTDAVSLTDRLRNLPQHLYPQHTLTALAYRITRIRTPWLKNLLIRAFIKAFGVDMREAAESDPLRYDSFNAFFTRALNPAVRPLASGEDVLCCPVDGTVSQAGAIDDEHLFQAKGKTFPLTALLGGDPDLAAPFRHGSFATLYLSPRDYHRIHMPIDGTLRSMIHIPGRLFSVSPLTTRVIPELFARNERVVTLFETAAGPMALILVGAINVASVETVWAGAVTPYRSRELRHWHYPTDSADTVRLAKGAEMGRFNMGSTVIVLFGPGAVDWDDSIAAERQTRMGQLLARIRPDQTETSAPH